MLTIGTNSAALRASAAIAAAQVSHNTSMSRLSTGARTFSAANDAAGISMSSRLNAEVRGINQAVQNALAAQSLVDTAEGALIEIENIGQRLREILVQAANDTNSYSDRESLQEEADSLLAEIDRIGASTTWAGQALFTGVDGSETGDDGTEYDFNTFTFLVGGGAGTANSLSINIYKYGGDAIPDAVLAFSAAYSPSLIPDMIDFIDDSLGGLSEDRADLGSLYNRLGHTINNLTNISTNLAMARGRIRDADFAAETTNLAKQQILMQAGTAMLAQANASKQNVLSLLQG